MPSNHLILCRPLLLPLSISPSIKVFSNESVLHLRWPKYWEFQLQHQSFQWIVRTDGLVGSPCSPRDSQESSPTPQFKSINSLVLSFLYSPTLPSIHDHCSIYTNISSIDNGRLFLLLLLLFLFNPYRCLVSGLI